MSDSNFARRTTLALALVGALLGAGCASPGERIRASWDAQAAPPQRIGFVCLAAPDAPSAERVGTALRDALSDRLGASAVVIPGDDPDTGALRAGLVRGRIPADAVLGASGRHGVDALLVGRVTSYRPFPPQAIGLELALVSTLTGEVVWSALGVVDAADPGTRRAAEGALAGVAEVDPVNALGDVYDPSDGFLTLESPDAFARFAARTFCDTIH